MHDLISDRQYLNLFETARNGSTKPSGVLRGIRAVIAAYEAACPPAVQGVPEGWKLVPVEPSEEMLRNVDEEVGGHCYSCTRWKASDDDCRKVWAAMLETSPPLPSVAEPVQLSDEEQMFRAGRVLADRNADACGVNREDNWKLYGEDFKEDARACLAAARGESKP